MNSGKVILGIVAGLAAGAVLGVIFAPKKESKAKKDIERKSASLVEAINDTIEKKFEEAMEVVTRKLQKNKGDDIAQN